MTKIVEFLKNDLIGSIVFNVGEVAGFDDKTADTLITKGFAKLKGDGKSVKVGEKLPPGPGDFGYPTEPKSGKAA